VTIENDESLTIHIPVDHGIKPKFLLKQSNHFQVEGTFDDCSNDHIKS
jgi:hypothetical protein